MQPQFPIYIPSKSRHDSRMTMKALDKMGAFYRVIVEEQQYADYAAVIDKSKLLVLDKAYQRNYDTFDNLGDSKSKGPGPARNFAWDHSMSEGHPWHWVMDDNIHHFYRFNNNIKIRTNSASMWRVQEDFVLRYENIGMAGPNYSFFCPRKVKFPPITFNNRIYSCNLIRNNLPFRWRGRYNEDTDLSLRILKAGLCTVQFNVFLQEKAMTQTVKGGNMDEFYAQEGTLPKSKMQVAMHPDVSKLVWKFRRWHHQVDYGPFKQNKLIRKENYDLENGKINEYGLSLVRNIT